MLNEHISKKKKRTKKNNGTTIFMEAQTNMEAKLKTACCKALIFEKVRRTKNDKRHLDKFCLAQFGEAIFCFMHKSFIYLFSSKRGVWGG